MKLLCINGIEIPESRYKPKSIFTYGKIYEIYEIADFNGNRTGRYIIGMDIRTFEGSFIRENFISLKEYRKLKLEKIYEGR